MTTDKTKLLNEKMNELRKAYGTSLAGHLEVINKLVGEINKTNAQSDYLELKVVAHKLVGTGRTFNFPEISDSARALENFIDQESYNKEQMAVLAQTLIEKIKESIDEISSNKNKVIQNSSNTQFPLNTRILIADDDEIILRMLRNIFRPTGCEIICANDGTQAMQYLQEDIFPLIILDGMMPGYNGIELVKYIKSNSRYSNSRVMLLTAKDSKENIEEGLAAGADCYLTKPFDPQDIVQKSLDMINSIQ